MFFCVIFLQNGSNLIFYICNIHILFYSYSLSIIRRNNHFDIHFLSFIYSISGCMPTQSVLRSYWFHLSIRSLYSVTSFCFISHLSSSCLIRLFIVILRFLCFELRPSTVILRIFESIQSIDLMSCIRINFIKLRIYCLNTAVFRCCWRVVLLRF